LVTGKPRGLEEERKARKWRADREQMAKDIMAA